MVISYATANGSAIAGRDYTATSGTLTLTSDTTSVRIMVPTEQDDLFEGAEKYTFTLRLVSGPNGVALQKSTVTGTINDAADALTATVEADQDAIVEGSTATFRVILAKKSDDTLAGSSAPVLVDYLLSGLDEEDHDGSATGTLTIPAGQTTGTIAVRTVTDDVLEGDETLTVTLEKAITGERVVEVSNPTDGSNSTVVGDQGRKVTVSIDDISVDEGDAAVFTVSVSRSVSAAVQLTVEISGDVEAADYQSNPPATVTIAADMMTAKLTIETRHDDLVEGPEELTVTLSGSPPTGVGLGKVAGTATIRDGDTLQASVMGPSTVPEGLPATYTVTLDGETSTAEVVVDYRISGTASADVDYTDDELWNGSLTIAAEGTTGTITIPTMAVEGDGAGETMVVTLTDAATEKGTATVGTPRAVTTTFTPQDTVTVSVVAPTPPTIAEGASGTFTVTLTGGAHTSGLVVNYTIGGDVAEGDYQGAASSGTHTFGAADDRSESITLTTVDDTLEEGDETVTVTLSLSGQASNVSLGTPISVGQDHGQRLAVRLGSQRQGQRGRRWRRERGWRRDVHGDTYRRHQHRRRGGRVRGGWRCDRRRLYGAKRSAEDPGGCVYRDHYGLDDRRHREGGSRRSDGHADGRGNRRPPGDIRRPERERQRHGHCDDCGQRRRNTPVR